MGDGSQRAGGGAAALISLKQKSRQGGLGLAIAISGAAIFTACDGTSDTACTEIGCGDGLYVVVQALSFNPGAHVRGLPAERARLSTDLPAGSGGSRSHIRSLS